MGFSKVDSVQFPRFLHSAVATSHPLSHCSVLRFKFFCLSDSWVLVHPMGFSRGFYSLLFAFLYLQRDSHSIGEMLQRFSIFVCFPRLNCIFDTVLAVDGNSEVIVPLSGFVSTFPFFAFYP